ncbi:MAG: hypothetical protein ACREPG_00825 [Candidatus Binatia bacterium]
MCIDLPSRQEVLNLQDWNSLKRAYLHLNFTSEPFERVEEYGASVHKLNERLSNVQEFWRYHIAPATNRPEGTHLSDNIRGVTSRLAERSYEIYCNVSDALDELAEIKKGLKPPRYRSCLNVLRFSGDALLLFDSLIDIIGVKTKGQDLANQLTLSKLFSENSEKIIKIILFPDWYYGENWNAKREQAIAYRNMLVHHGRPWLHFTKGEYTSPPYILRAEHCRLDISKHEDKKEFLTWGKQIQMFRDANHRDKFIRLDRACKHTCDFTILWLNAAYGRIVKTLDKILTERPQRFQRYRKQWGIARSSF